MEVNTLKVFVAGANGAIGKPLVTQLVSRGYDVVAMTRSPKNDAALRAAGAEPVVVDALNRDALIEAVKRAEPDIVMHELTALTGMKDFKHFDDEFAMTNRLRTEGTDNLLAAALTAGARRFIAQSFGNWNYERTGTLAKTEDDPLDSNRPKNQTQSFAAICHLENTVLGAAGIEGVVLRYGNLYGPGTGFAAHGDLAEMVRKRAFPIVGNGAGVWSFIHVDDAASATVAAIQHGAPGVYNIVDDDPAPVSTWLPEYARAIGARSPFHIPVWLGRLAAGEVGVSVMTKIHGASNAKAKRELGWTPFYATWRQGFQTGLG
jgi:nucleoside-diphosphate-sugar epimerase